MELNDHQNTLPDQPESNPQETPEIPSEEKGKEPPSRRWHLVLTGLRYLGYALAGFVLFSFFVVLLGKWIHPVTTSFILQQRFSHVLNGEEADIHYQWTQWKSISPHVPLAVVAAEDQKFPNHFGFDLESIAKAQEENKARRWPRGASTITQQVTKNLYLWPGRSYFRKGLEAYFALLLELLWSKRRILEVYVNIAEFGPNIYGVGAAAQTFWNTTPKHLTKRQAALLAAVLPSPKRLHADQPSAYVEQRVGWILTNMRQLGPSYLDDL